MKRDVHSPTWVYSALEPNLLRDCRLTFLDCTVFFSPGRTKSCRFRARWHSHFPQIPCEKKQRETRWWKVRRGGWTLSNLLDKCFASITDKRRGRSPRLLISLRLGGIPPRLWHWICILLCKHWQEASSIIRKASSLASFEVSETGFFN